MRETQIGDLQWQILPIKRLKMFFLSVYVFLPPPCHHLCLPLPPSFIFSIGSDFIYKALIWSEAILWWLNLIHWYSSSFLLNSLWINSFKHLFKNYNNLNYWYPIVLFPLVKKYSYLVNWIIFKVSELKCFPSRILHSTVLLAIKCEWVYY